MIVFRCFSGGASYSRAEQKFAQKISDSDIKISAKILKVSIKRPWFKSSLFKSNQFQMVSFWPWVKDVFTFI